MTIADAQSVSGADFADVVHLRGLYYYEDPLDPRYAQCGIHKQLTARQLLDSHLQDRGSQYLFARDADHRLHGYLRLSILDNGSTPHDSLRDDIRRLLAPELQQSPICMVWIVMVSPKCAGRNVSVVGRGEHLRLSRLLYADALRIAATQGAELAVADIYVSPRANKRSLVLHERLGFRSLGYPLIVEEHASVEIHSIRLARPVADDRVLLRGADGWTLGGKTLH